jgi:hypothetical protein
MRTASVRLFHATTSITPSQRYTKLVTNLAPLRTALVQHKMYDAIHTKLQLQVFMASHVFAVWDFMSLVKTLQHRLAPAHAPWTPPKQAYLAGVINEIVVAEESDRVPPHLLQLAPQLAPRVSHLALYLEAMREAGESGVVFRRFLGHLEARRFGVHGGHAPDLVDARIALGKTLELPVGVDAFCRTTLAQCAPNKTTHEVAAAFLFGREDPIPAMFTKLLERLDVTRSGIACLDDDNTVYPFMRFYLERHIELDGDEHAHLGRDMLCELCQDRTGAWNEAEKAAQQAIVARIALWDAIAQRL